MPFDYDVTVSASAPSSSEVTAGQVFRITADDLSGSTLTDSVGSLALTATGTPNTETSPEGVNLWLNFDGAAEAFSFTGVGDLPVGNASRTLIFCGRFDTVGAGTTAAWGGFTYGGTTTGTAFGLLADGFEHTLDLDLTGTDYVGPSIDDGEPVIVAVTYDSTTGTLLRYDGKVSTILETDFGLNTGTTSIRIMRNSAGTQFRNGNIAYVAVYDTVLTPAQISQMVDWLNAEYLADETPPSITSVSFTATGTETGALAFTLDEQSTAWVILSETNTAPSALAVKLGQDGAGAAPFARQINGTGAQSISVAGLDANTTYYPFVYAEDGFGNASTVTGGTSDSTDAAAAAPTSITPTAISFSESTNVGAQVAQFAADQSPVTWSLPDSPTDYAIDATTGALTLLTAKTPGSSTLDVRATNGDGNFTQEVAITITEASTSAFSRAADTTSTWANLPTLLDSFSGETPNSGDYIIEITGPASSNVDLSGIEITTGRAIITPARNGFTESMNADGMSYVLGTGADYSGILRMNGTKGVWFYRCAFLGNTALRPWNNCTGSGVEECYFRGTYFDPMTPQATSAGGGFCLVPGQDGNNTSSNPGITGFTVKNCAFQFANNAAIQWRANTDCVQDGCVSAWLRHDNYKILGASTRFQFTNNWGCRDFNVFADSHTDGLQMQIIAATDMVVTGNVFVRGTNFPVDVLDAFQCFFADSRGSWSGGIFEQNLIHHLHANQFFIDFTASPSPICRYNEGLRIYAVGQGASQTLTSPGKPSGMSAASISKNYGAGMDNENWGNNDGLYITNQTSSGAKSTPNDFDHAVLVSRGDLTARMDDDNWDLEPIEPPSTATRRHWDNPNPVGAYLTLKRIFEDKDVPKDWPRGIIWKRQYDRTNYLVPARSGNFDQYGNDA